MDGKGPPGKKWASAQLEARIVAARAEAAEVELRRAIRIDTWVDLVIPRLYNEPHNIGGLLSPHLVTSVVNIVLRYVVEANGSGKLLRTDGNEVSFSVPGYSSLNRLATTLRYSSLNRPEVPVRLIFKGSNVELPEDGDCGSQMNIFTGRFPDLELRMGAGANVYSCEEA